MDEFPAYILAGGRSSRFGEDKARSLRDGRPLLSTIAEGLGSLSSRVVVVAGRAAKYRDLGLETIADLEPGLGPLGGLLTAVLDRRERNGEGWLLLAPCDLVDLDVSLLGPLHRAISSASTAIAFRSNRWHPLPGLYHTSIQTEVRRRLARDDRSLWGLLEAVDASAVALPDGWSGWKQANAPEEL